jgi:hypothetical protein
MPAKKHTTTAHRHTKAPPPAVNTPEEKRKFFVLVILSGVVVVLIWIATLPFNLQQDGPATAGPKTFFGTIAEQLSSASRIGDLYNDVRDAQQSQ